MFKIPAGPRRIGLFPKFLAVTVAAALLPIALLGGSLYQLAVKTLRDNVSNYYLAVTDDVSLLLDRELDRAGSALGRIAAALENPAMPVKARLELATEEMRQAHCDPYLVIYGRKGELLDMLKPAGRPFPFPRPDALAETLKAEGPGPAFGGIVYPQGGGFPRLRLARRWKGGWLELYYDLRPVSDYIADVSARRFRGPDVLFLVSPSGTVLGGGDSSAVMERRSFAGLGTAPAGPAAGGTPGAAPAYSVISGSRDASGVKYLSFYVPLARYGLGVAIRERESAVFPALGQTRFLVLLWSCAAVLLAVALAFLLTRGLLKRLDVLMAGIRKMSAGRQPGLLVAVSSGDELGDLAESFNTMSSELARSLEEITTARVDAELLRHTLEVARLVVDAMPSGVILCGEDGTARSVNGAARRLLPLLPGEPLPEALFRGDAGNPAGAAWETELAARGGRRLPALATSVRVELAGEKMLIVSFADISDLKKAQAELAAARDAAVELARFKSEFLASMSHEIRTPIQSILGYSDLLQRAGLDARQLELLAPVLRSGENLLGIINNILEFSKAESGEITLEEAEFSVRDVVEGVGDVLAHAAQAKGIELATLVETGVQASVTGDAARLGQVLTNLAGNAVKFTEKGSVFLRVARAGTGPAGEAALVFTVSDTGIGFSAEEKERLFKAFSQANASTTRKYGGTGLGLALSGKIAGLLGGSIEARGEPGKGAVFTLTLPFALPAGGGAAAAPAKPLAGLRALVRAGGGAIEGAVNYYLAAAGAAAAAGMEEADLLVLDTAEPAWKELADKWRSLGHGPRGALVLLRGLAPGGPEADGSRTVYKPVKAGPLLAAASGLPWPPVTAGSPLSGPAERTALPAAAGARVLLAEDNPVNRNLLLIWLGELGVEVTAAVDGKEAVLAFGRGSFGAVLMDCEMPELDGFGAAGAIRAAEAGRGRVPIIALTAGSGEDSRRRCLAAGMDDYLQKPVRKKELEELLAKWLRVPAAGGTGAYDDDAGIRAELLRCFAADAPGKAGELKKALAAGDLAELRRLAHYLKGSSLQAGLQEIGAICAGLEKRCASGVYSGAKEDVALIAAAVERAARGA